MFWVLVGASDEQFKCEVEHVLNKKALQDEEGVCLVTSTSKASYYESKKFRSETVSYYALSDYKTSYLYTIIALPELIGVLNEERCMNVLDALVERGFKTIFIDGVSLDKDDLDRVDERLKSYEKDLNVVLRVVS